VSYVLAPPSDDNCPSCNPKWLTGVLCGPHRVEYVKAMHADRGWALVLVCGPKEAEERFGKLMAAYKIDYQFDHAVYDQHNRRLYPGLYAPDWFAHIYNSNLPNDFQNWLLTRLTRGFRNVDRRSEFILGLRKIRDEGGERAVYSYLQSKIPNYAVYRSACCLAGEEAGEALVTQDVASWSKDAGLP